MILQILTIARNTLVESLRQPIYFILIALSGILQLFNTWTAAFSLGYTDTSEVSGDDKMLLDVGLATVFVCGMLLAAFVATAVLSREIENKTVLTVVSKPISRTAVVLGKFIGVSGAILLATIAMLVFLLLGIRHGVMSTAADELDGPVLLFAGLAVVLSVGLGAWCNFFYGWSFPQTASVILAAGSVVAYLLVLAVGKKWEFQPLDTDFKPQIALACVALVMAMLVLASIATAASTRLGQVMTVVVCAGVFVFGLLSNSLIGRYAFRNTPVARIATASPERPEHRGLAEPGDSYVLELEGPPTVTLRTGMPVYWGPNPSGYPMSVHFRPPPGGRPWEAPPPGTEMLRWRPQAPGVFLTEVAGQRLTVRRLDPATGAPQPPVRVGTPPGSLDFLFQQPTTINWIALVAWGVIPNMQAFWLLDAITQNQEIPAGHIVLVLIYGVLQVGAFLCLAVALFQKRDVG